MSGDVIEVECQTQNAEELEARLRQAAQQRHFGVLNVTDLRRKLEEKGIAYAGTARVYDVCNPQAAAEVLGRKPAVAAVLPCRIAMVESAGRLRLVMVRPSVLIGYFAPEMLPLAREIEAQLEMVLQEAAGAQKIAA